MPITNITRDNDGGEAIVSGGISWAAVRDAAVGDALVTLPSDGSHSMINTRETGGSWINRRHFIKFDLSGIPVGAIITAAQINIEVVSFTGAGFSWVVQESSYGSLSLDDYSNFTGPILGSASAPVGTGPGTLNLNATGLAYLESKVGGFAEFCFREFDFDYSDVDPQPNGYHRINTTFDDAPQTSMDVTWSPPTTSSTTSTTSSSTSSSTSTSTTTTTAPPILGRQRTDDYYYRHDQATANRLPAWMRARLNRYSNVQQLLQPLGKELEMLEERMRRNIGNLYLSTADMDWIDMVYQIDLPYSFEFEFDFTDPVNPRPKPPYVLGEIGTEEYPVVAVAENDIQSFWFDPLPDRISFGDEEIDVPVGPPGRIYSDVLEATAVGTGTLLATYDEPFIPGRLYITIAGADTFGFKNNLVDMPGYIEIHGVTVKDTEETERMAFTYNATRLTNKFWQEITDIKMINIGPEDATIAIASAGATMQQLSDSQYVEYDTIGSRESFWEIDSHTIGVTDYAVLQHILPVAETITDEPKAILSQSVHRVWLLRDGTGRHIRFSQVADYTIERFRPYIYVLLTDGRILVYSKLAEYPDLESVRLLKERTDGVKTVLSVDYDEGVAGDQVRLAARVSTKTKKVAFYYLEGTKPSDNGTVRYILTDGSWGTLNPTPAQEALERNQSRVTLETPTIDIPYRDYLMDLDEYGVYTFVLTTRYLDGTTDVDVQMVYSRSKVCLVWFDVYEVDPSIDTPLAICFDYNQRLWLGTGAVTTSSTTTTSTSTSTSTTSTTATASTSSSSTSTSSTSSTTTATCPGYFEDLFDDGIIGPEWTIVGTVTEHDDILEFTYAAPGLARYNPSVATPMSATTTVGMRVKFTALPTGGPPGYLFSVLPSSMSESMGIWLWGSGLTTIHYKTVAGIQTWNGAAWVSGHVPWWVPIIGEWYTVEIQSDGVQWRYSIKDSSEVIQVLTDWVPWADVLSFGSLYFAFSYDGPNPPADMEIDYFKFCE